MPTVPPYIRLDSAADCIEGLPVDGKIVKVGKEKCAGLLHLKLQMIDSESFPNLIPGME